MEHKIDQFLNKAKFRIWFIRFIDTIILGGLFVFGLGLLIMVLSFFTPIYQAYRIAIIGVGIGLLLLCIVTLFRIPGKKQAAMITDSMGLKERLSTSLELYHKEDNISLLQKKDTLQAIESFNLRKGLPLNINKKRALAFGLLLIVFVTSGFIPNDLKDKAEEMHQLKELQKEKIKELKEAEKKVESEDKVLTEEQKEAINEALEQAKNEIDKALAEQDVEKALERLDKKLEKISEGQEQKTLDFMNELRKELFPNSDSLKQSLAQSDENKIKEALKQNEVFQEIMEQLGNLEQDKLNELLSNLQSQLANMSQEELGQLAANLSEMAEQLSTEELQKLIEQMVDLLEKGELSEELLERISDVAKRLSQSSSSTGTPSLSTGTSGGQEGEGQEGQGSGEGEGTGQNQGSGQGQGQGSGQGAGQGSGQGAGQGSGQGQGQGSGQGGSGGQGAGSGSGWNYGSNQGFQRQTTTEKSNEEVFISGRELGEDDQLTGQHNSSGNSEFQQGGEALTQIGTSVRYDQVLGSYTEQAMQTIHEYRIPEVMKDVIKEYFEGLNQ